MHPHFSVRLGCALVVLMALFASPASAQVTAFSTDVSAAIDSGLARLNLNGAYGDSNTANGCSSSAGNAAGLAALALLEKRANADQDAVSQGYSGATAADKLKLDEIICYIINSHTGAGFYAYRDGADLMALSVYLRTGGPNSAGALASLNAIFDRTMANQRTAANGYPNDGNQGYWCYNNGGCLDASTTQLVMAGLAAARSIYLSGPFADAGRLASLNNAATIARTAYASIPQQNPLTPTERGHGYNRGDTNSLQQTGSGLWVQLVGGADINTMGVQNYLEWIRHRYDYPDQDNANGGWSQSDYYWLWTAAKAFEFLETSGVAAAPGNLDTDDLGTLPPAAAPAVAGRLMHLDPNTVARPAVRGPGGAGYYASPSEPARWYFDFAYSLMTQQDAAGNFNAAGSWEYYSNQSYALLVLQRSVGGGCLDGDDDGVCNEDDNCVAVANPGQENRDGDALGDACDQQTANIKLNLASAPGVGTSGISNITVTGGGWPAVAIPAGDANIFISTVCMGGQPVATKSTAVTTILGTTKRATFKIPAGLAGNTYYVWLNGPAGGGYASTNCSRLLVIPAP